MNRKLSATFLALIILLSDVLPCTAALALQTKPKETTAGNQWKGKRVAFLGDSITDKRQSHLIYWQYLAEMLDIIPLVYGISGHQWTGVLGQAEQLWKEHGDSVDCIFIFAGTNDYRHDTPLGEWFSESAERTLDNGQLMVMRKRRTHIMSDSTFCGRINLVMDYLKTHYPTKQIILLTPLHRAFARFGENNIQPDEQYANALGYFIDDYVEKIKQAGNIWAVPVIDIHSLSGLYPLNSQHAIYFRNKDTDLLHPNGNGHKRIAETLYYQMIAMPATF